MQTALYQFEDGQYSDWSVSPIVRGPADADLEGLRAEWLAELREHAQDEPGDDSWIYATEQQRAEAWGLPGPDADDWWSDCDWFARWLDKRPEWEIVECTRFAAAVRP